MRSRVYVLVVLLTLLLISLTIPPVLSSNYLISRFREQVSNRMKWFRIIYSNNTVSDLYGSFSSYGESMIVLLIDSDTTFSRISSRFEDIVKKYTPPVIVIASNKGSPYWYIGRLFDLSIRYEIDIIDLRYGLVVPGRTVYGYTVFYDPLGFRNISGQGIRDLKVLGELQVFNGDSIESIPCIVEIDTVFRGKTVKLFLIGTPEVFLITNGYLDEALHYMLFREYLINVSIDNGVRGAVLIEALSEGLNRPRTHIEEVFMEEELSSAYSGKPVGMGKGTDFVFSIPKSFLPIITAIALLMTVFVYVVVFTNIYWVRRRLPYMPEINEVDETVESGLHISKLYSSRDPRDFIMAIVRGGYGCEFIVIESYYFIDKLFRDKTGYGVMDIIKRKNVLQTISSRLGIDPHKLRRDLVFLHNLFIRTALGKNIEQGKWGFLINRLLTILSELSNRLEGI